VSTAYTWDTRAELEVVGKAMLGCPRQIQNLRDNPSGQKASRSAHLGFGFASRALRPQTNTGSREGSQGTAAIPVLLACVIQVFEIVVREETFRRLGAVGPDPLAARVPSISVQSECE
jgi:hypothetical protein